MLTQWVAVHDVVVQQVGRTLQEDTRPDVVEPADVPLVVVHRQLVERRNHLTAEREVHRTDREILPLLGDEVTREVRLLGPGLGLSLQVAVHQDANRVEVRHVRPQPL